MKTVAVEKTEPPTPVTSAPTVMPSAIPTKQPTAIATPAPSLTLQYAEAHHEISTYVRNIGLDIAKSQTKRALPRMDPSVYFHANSGTHEQTMCPPHCFTYLGETTTQDELDFGRIFSQTREHSRLSRLGLPGG